VSECIRQFARSISIIDKQGSSSKHWDFLIDCSDTRISDLASTSLRWKWYMADETNLYGKQHKVALDKFAQVGVQQSKKRIDETLTKKRKRVHVSMYVITLMVLLLLLMMCRNRRRGGRNLGS